MELSQRLSFEHLKMLRQESGIHNDLILGRGYRTVTENGALSRLGFSAAQQRAPGLLIPVWSVTGENGLHQFRPDNPRVKEDKRKRDQDGSYKNTVIKYETPAGSKMQIDVHPACLAKIGDPSVDLWITEGVKKGDALVSRGLAAIALLGVWNWRGSNDLGGVTALPDWESVALKGRKVKIVFDNDVMRKLEVQHALRRFTTFLQGRGAFVDHVYLPAGEQKIGVDDYLASGKTIADLEALVQAPRLNPQPAPDQIELLDDSPATIARPLALINGQSYAATWMSVKVTRTEELGRNGEIIRHQPAKQTFERRLFIIRGDGVIFGDGGDAPLDDLGLLVHLPETPRAEKLWSTRGVKAFHKQERPHPSSVFEAIVNVVDHFIDFDRSLSDQHTMSEMVACYILTTWFLDAFDVIGFLWPNGERGSGKTHLLMVVAELAYLGEVITAGGTFASLRDLADYGAALAFDDAESLSDHRTTDPDKRALLLAGNRRGVSIPLKELADDRKWVTRYVNVYCPRLFSAIRLPDPVLASRTIIVPLIRTNDRAKANIDPLDESSWPCSQRDLLDDLWALALAHLPRLPAWDHWVADHARLSGRNLQPWRALLAVAAWLEDQGMSGLWNRMDNLSYHYHIKERQELEIPDLTILVVRSMLEVARTRLDLSGIKDIWDVKHPDSHALMIETQVITEMAVKLVKEEELEFDPERVTARRVGRTLGKLRLAKDTSHGAARGWVVTVRDLRRWADTYGLVSRNVLDATAPAQAQAGGQSASADNKAKGETWLSGTL